MVKPVFLFPGQGAQYPLMAIDLLESSAAVRALFDQSSEANGRDMEALLRTADAETLKRTDVSQSAITLANLSAAAALAERGVQPLGCAGFSLGEYAMFAVSGVLDPLACFRLVAARGKAMQETADEISATSTDGAAPGMTAVLGLPPEKVEELIAAWTADGLTGLYPANFNSPAQTVVAGTSAALAEAELRFKAAGAKRTIRLKVAGPFHSPLVAPAAARFAKDLEKAEFGEPRLPLFSNVTGKRISGGAEAKALALRQITEPVRWTAELAAIAAAFGGVEGGLKALETGPGKVLQGLWKDSVAESPCLPGGTLADIETAVADLGQ